MRVSLVVFVAPPVRSPRVVRLIFTRGVYVRRFKRLDDIHFLNGEE